jgi:hypothetical protein
MTRTTLLFVLIMLAVHVATRLVFTFHWLAMINGNPPAVLFSRPISDSLARTVTMILVGIGVLSAFGIFLPLYYALRSWSIRINSPK